MRKITFSINITIDGFADHTAGIADDELHDFFSDQLDETGIILFGRKTYDLMASFWPNAANDPRSTKSITKFAEKFNMIEKIVFSKTLKEVTWNNTTLAKNNLADEVLKLKEKRGKNISAGSLSIGSQLLELGLIDEFWFLVHPIILGKGKPLFEDFKGKADLKLIETRNFKSGVVVLHYKKGQKDL